MLKTANYLCDNSYAMRKTMLALLSPESGDAGDDTQDIAAILCDVLIDRRPDLETTQTQEDLCDDGPAYYIETHLDGLIGRYGLREILGQLVHLCRPLDEQS